MDDLISRQAAIDALTEYGNGRAVFISVGEAVIRIEQLPPAQPEPHWIPVTERLPRKRDHKDDMVLVCNENGSIRFNTCINGTWVYGNPIAWMPLPEAFKGETE